MLGKGYASLGIGYVEGLTMQGIGYASLGIDCARDRLR
jgi:hypothetical protein